MSKEIMKQYLVLEITENTLFLSTTLGGSIRVFREYYMVTFFNTAVNMNVEKQWIKWSRVRGWIEEIRVKRWGKGGGIYDGDEEQVIFYCFKIKNKKPQQQKLTTNRVTRCDLRCDFSLDFISKFKVSFKLHDL